MRKFILEHQLALIGLVETKIKEVNKEKVLRTIAKGWGFLNNYSSSPIGIIWVCWDPSGLKVSLMGQSDQVIHCLVKDASGFWHCVVSIIYGDNCPSRRESLWANLISFAAGVRDMPWIVSGDFNDVRGPEERMGGSLDWPIWMDNFEEAISHAELNDLRFVGAYFTWSNRREEGLIRRKLDRVLSNATWECKFPGSEARFLPAGVSDHSPTVIKLAELPGIKRPFKFFDFWADHPDLILLVEKVWREEVVGFPMYQLCCNLRRLKAELRKLNKEWFSDLPNRTAQAKEKPAEIQNLAQRSPTDISLVQEEVKAVK